MGAIDLRQIATRHCVFIAFIGYVLLAAFVLGANPLRGQIAGPFDLLLSQGGWGSEVGTGQVHHFERSDALDFYLPRWIQSRQALRQGQLPLWNDLSAGGEPGLLNLANGELTPAFAVFALSPNPAYGYYVAVVLNLALGGCGVFFFLYRRLRLFAAAFGGVVFMLCGFTAAWLYSPHVTTVIWICWLLGSLDRCWHRPSFASMLAVAASFALLLLGGFPFVTVLGAGAAALFVLCLTLIERPQNWRAPLKHIVVGFACGLGLAAPGLLGLGEWLAQLNLGYRMSGSFLAGLSNMKYLLRSVAINQPDVETTMYAGRLAESLALIMLLAVLALMIVRRRRPQLVEIFALLLGVIGSILIFEIIPSKYLLWVPGLAGNSWSRAICLLDLAIAIAAASALNVLGNMMHRTAYLAFAVVLLVLQVRDSGHLFRQFNGAVPAWMFYPKVALLEKIRAHTAPFQSVIADDNFLVSGTLGAYGIAEWFGHGFKTDALKRSLEKVVDDPFDSPTASRIEAETFRLGSPVINALAIRYVIGDGGVFSRPATPFSISVPTLKQPLPTMPEHRLVQSFVLDRAIKISGFHLLMGTFMRSNQKGVLNVSFTEADKVTPLQVWNIPVEEILDNQSLFFELPAPIGLEKGRYLLGVTYSGASSDDQLTIWSSPGAWSGCQLTVDDQAASGCMNLSLDIPSDSLGSFAAIDRVGGIYLLENRSVPGGAYYLPTLDSVPLKSSSDLVRLLNYSNREFEVRYDGADRGFIVFPMNFRRDWHVYIDGKRVRPTKYLEALPAVLVTGACTVKLLYRPLALMVGVPVFGLTLFLILLIWARRRRCLRPNSDRASNWR
jgi:hypothetical protein